MALFTKYAKNVTKFNFFIILQFDQIVKAFKNIEIYKINNEWYTGLFMASSVCSK